MRRSLPRWGLRPVLIGLLSAGLLTVASPRARAEVSLVVAKAYVDVEAGKLVSPARILVVDGVIEAVNAEAAPSGAQVIDLGERILLPGLMDMHTHLDFDFYPGSFDIAVKESASDGALRAAKNAATTLQAGFTTVRNVGQVHATLDLVVVALAHATAKGWVPGPRIVAAGHMISILGGHGDLSMAEGLAEGMLELGPEYGIVAGVDDARRAARFQIKHGAKSLKIHATAGVLSLEDSVGAQQLTAAEMNAVVEEANLHGLPVAAHAHGTRGIKAAIRAGVSSIEHGSILDDEAIKLMLDRGVVLVPTRGLMDLLPIKKLPAKKRAKAEYVSPLAQRWLRRAIKAGVKIAIGTDAPLIPHGKNAFELRSMVENGMSPADALRSATVVPAELIRRKDLGQLKPGMLADVIAVDGNPLQDITLTERVSFVMKGGKVFRQP
ncbi:MAG: amidohydrolase family protein [Myxococcota bacterium]